VNIKVLFIDAPKKCPFLFRYVIKITIKNKNDNPTVELYLITGYEALCFTKS